MKKQYKVSVGQRGSYSKTIVMFDDIFLLDEWLTKMFGAVNCTDLEITITIDMVETEQAKDGEQTW